MLEQRLNVAPQAQKRKRWEFLNDRSVAKRRALLPDLPVATGCHHEAAEAQVTDVFMHV